MANYNLFDAASLAMIPTGVKEDKLYSIKPTDGSGDFTFSRGSDIQSTRVNASGLIEKAKENNLLQSNSFGTTWFNTNSTETGGQAGYDGTNNAWLIEKSAGFGRIAQSISVSGVHTASVYVKAGTLSWCRFLMLPVAAGTDPQVYVNLATGALGSQYNNITATSTSVGGGWYRLTLTFQQAITEFRIYPAEGNNNVGGTSGNIYIQDAALCHGLVAQDYIETITTAVVEGLTADLPRLDYSGGASCPSLLLEPSRTNYATQSEYIGAWSQNDLVGTDNFAVSPEGVQNASKVSASLTSASHFIQLTGGSVGNTATISLFAKADTGSYIQLTNPYSGANFANFDVATGVVGTKGANCTSSSIEDYGNGWYRCTAVFDFVGTSHTYRHHIVSSASAVFGQTWLPASDTSLFIYGHSWESGSYPTSYIPTYGTAANRGADAAYKTGISSLIGQTEGTLFYDVNVPSLDNSGFEVSMVLNDGTTNNEIYMAYYQTGRVQAVAFVGGALVVNINLPSYGLTEGVHKFAFAYKNNDYNFFIDGASVGTDTSAGVPATSVLKLARRGTGGPSINYKQALLFPTRLTNAELAALTTI